MNTTPLIHFWITFGYQQAQVKTVSVPELHLGKVGIYQEMYTTYIQ